MTFKRIIKSIELLQIDLITNKASYESIGNLNVIYYELKELQKENEKLMAQLYADRFSQHFKEISENVKKEDK